MIDALNRQRAPRLEAVRLVRLDTERGKRRALCAAAIARKLTGFCWAASTAD